jgi:hypothetical protein
MHLGYLGQMARNRHYMLCRKMVKNIDLLRLNVHNIKIMIGTTPEGGTDMQHPARRVELGHT